METQALLIVDVQNDFCPCGALAVPHGDEVVAPLNRLIEMMTAGGGRVIASRDWHPRNSSHFAEFGGRWPMHCVQNTKGAEFHPGLRLPADAIIISKGLKAEGISKEVDGYSAFDGVTAEWESLESVLRRLQIKRIHVGGLATDYCVQETVLSARHLRFSVDVELYACKGLADNTTSEAIRKMYHQFVVIHNAPFVPRFGNS